MTWVFAILLVLALGGVAAAAAGRGVSLPEAFDDRTDSRVPGAPVSGADLRAVRFPLALRGYRMGEVDELLDLLAHQLEAQQDEIDRLRRPGSEPPAGPVDGPPPSVPGSVWGDLSDSPGD